MSQPAPPDTSGNQYRQREDPIHTRHYKHGRDHYRRVVNIAAIRGAIVKTAQRDDPQYKPKQKKHDRKGANYHQRKSEAAFDAPFRSRGNPLAGKRIGGLGHGTILEQIGLSDLD